jgi:hypothetical protein
MESSPFRYPILPPLLDDHLIPTESDLEVHYLESSNVPANNRNSSLAQLMAPPILLDDSGIWDTESIEGVLRDPRISTADSPTQTDELDSVEEPLSLKGPFRDEEFPVPRLSFRQLY